MKNPMIKNTVILTVITLISGLLLGTVYGITKEPIEKQIQESTLTAYKLVLPEAQDFEELTDLTYPITSEDGDVSIIVKGLGAGGEVVGYVVNVTNHESYGGDVTLAVGVKSDKTVGAIEVLEINDTPGLGMKAKEEDFKKRFVGTTLDGTDNADALTAMSGVDAISGATITTGAVKRAVYAALKAVEDI